MLKLAYSFFLRSMATFLGTLPGIGSYGSITWIIRELLWAQL